MTPLIEHKSGRWRSSFIKTWKLLLSEWLFAFWIFSGSTKGGRIQMIHFFPKKAAKLTIFFAKPHSSEEKLFGTLDPNYFSFFSLSYDWWISEITHATPPPQKKTLNFLLTACFANLIPKFLEMLQILPLEFSTFIHFPDKTATWNFPKSETCSQQQKITFDFFGTLRQKRSKQMVSFQPQRLFSKTEAPKNQQFLPAHTFLKTNTKIKYDAPLLGEKNFFQQNTNFFCFHKVLMRSWFFLSSIGFSCILCDTELF